MAYMTEWFLPDTRTGSLILDAKGGFDHAQGTRSSAKEEDAPVSYVAPFNLAFNTKLGFFPWLELPENRSRLERFGHAMTGTRQWETKEGVLFGEWSRVRLAVAVVEELWPRIPVGGLAARFCPRRCWRRDWVYLPDRRASPSSCQSGSRGQAASRRDCPCGMSRLPFYHL